MMSEKIPMIGKRLLLLGLSLLSTSVFAEMRLNMPRGVTPLSQEIYDLHMLIFMICVGIGIVVFGALFYALIRHRKAAGHEAATFHANAGFIRIIR